MLANLVLKNWMSFKDETQFSLVARDYSLRKKNIPRLVNYNVNLLPLATIFGGNASGKSNFVAAMKFAQTMIVNGTDNGQRIPVSPFLLDKSCKSEPSEFTFEIIIDETLYEYGFSADRERIHWERLTLINADNSEEILIDREGDKIDFGENKNTVLRNVAETTRPNQLILKNSVYLNVNDFKKIYDWFKQSILIITPGSRWNVSTKRFTNESNLMRDQLQKLLFSLDTGVVGIDSRKISESSINSIIERGRINPDQIEEGSDLSVVIDHNIYTFYKEFGEIKVEKLVFLHKTVDKEKVSFEFSQESDGTVRLLHLLPAFIYLTLDYSLSVLIIDEVDRSLHSMLNRNLIEFYLRTCSQKTQTQLICTTHDLYLMSRLELRRDEIWVTNRDIAGCTHLQSLGAFKDISEKDNILELYENGRLGGIPRIMYESSNLSPFSTK